MIELLLLTSEFPPYHGGIGNYAIELARAAHAAGASVTVVAPDYGEDQGAFDESLPFRVIRYPDGPASMRGLPKRLKVAAKALADARYDVVHAADWPFFIPLRLLTRRSPVRRLLTLHGTEIVYMNRPKRRLALSLLGFWRSGWAEWIGNSRFTENLALSTLPVSPSDAKTVLLGVSEDWKKARTPRAAARRALEVTDGRFVIVSAGRVVPRKGHVILAEALGLLPGDLARRVDWWICGPLIEEDYARSLRSAAERLPARTSFFGSVSRSELQERMSAADLFCLPGYEDSTGRIEGFGLVFIEAGAYGVPSLSTVSGGIPEVIEDGVGGLLVPERDPAALAEAIQRLMEDDGLRRRLGEGAHARAEALTWEQTALGTYGLKPERHAAVATVIDDFIDAPPRRSHG